MNDTDERSCAASGSVAKCHACGAGCVEGYDAEGVLVRVPARSRWIAATQRLPARSGDYLVFLDDYQRSVIVMNGCLDDGDWYWSDDWDRAKYVTHWMPLPAPPETSK